MLRTLLLFSSLVCFVQATILILPNPYTRPRPSPSPSPTPCMAVCNIYNRELRWALQDCICRPFQNPCLMEKENSLRLSKRLTPLVPVSEELCRYFIPKFCPPGIPVVAEFPKPPACGCKNKPGIIIVKHFRNLCELQKYSAENSEGIFSLSLI
ncbi:hypothetical protein KR222_009079, partial [Zaprionus bogoriensis]